MAREGSIDQQLLDRLGEEYLKECEKPLNKDLLQQLPKFKYVPPKGEEEKKENSDEHKCSVCLCEYEEGDNLLMLPCFHKYHGPCITGWFTKQNFCPVCRTKVK